VTRINLEEKVAETSDGQSFHYEQMVSTLPLTELIKLTGQPQLQPSAERGLLYSSSNIIGIGLRGQPRAELAKKCWMYFPEDNCPFYRVTVFSNYSPNNVPDIKQHWSLMAEVSESAHQPVDQARLLDQVIAGLLATKLIERREDIVSTWQFRAGYGYPTPGLERDAALAEIIPFYEKHEVFSRGRFGLWKYEVSNQDHSFMQGVEVVERLVNGCEEVTAQNPNLANSKKHPWPYEVWR
jgi:protoporphyrinogen oxidase